MIKKNICDKKIPEAMVPNLSLKLQSPSGATGNYLRVDPIIGWVVENLKDLQ